MTILIILYYIILYHIILHYMCRFVEYRDLGRSGFVPRPCRSTTRGVRYPVWTSWATAAQQQPRAANLSILDGIYMYI